MNNPKKLPYFPFYYLDWLSSSETAVMTYEEKGLYIDMLCRCYNDGSLPDDIEALERLFNTSEELLNSVLRMFYLSENSYKNKKMDSVIKNQKKMITAKRKAGKASAKARNNNKIQSATPVEHVLDSVATKSQRNSTNKTKQNKAKQSNIDRENAFVNEAATVNGSHSILSTTGLDKFTSHWTESKPNGKKLKFEMEKTFDIKRRMETWSTNAESWGSYDELPKSLTSTRPETVPQPRPQIKGVESDIAYREAMILDGFVDYAADWWKNIRPREREAEADEIARRNANEPVSRENVDIEGLK